MVSLGTATVQQNVASTVRSYSLHSVELDSEQTVYIKITNSLCLRYRLLKIACSNSMGVMSLNGFADGIRMQILIQHNVKQQRKTLINE